MFDRSRFNPILHGLSDTRISPGERNAFLFNFLTKLYSNAELGMRVGVRQNLLEKWVLSWWRHYSDITTIFSKKDVIGGSNFVHRFAY